MPPKKPANQQVPPAKVNDFMNVSGCVDKKLAEKLLLKNNLDVNNAVEEFFNGNFAETHGSKPNVDPKLLEAEFLKYNDGNDKMEQNGVVKFFEAASLEMEDVIVFIFSYECKAQLMGEFKKEEWIRGMTSLGVTSAQEFGQKANEFRARYKASSPAFNELFKFVFTFFNGGKKSIPGEEAAMLLGMVARGKYPLTDGMVNFLTKDPMASKEPIYKDTWNMIHHLLKTTKENGEGFSTEDAWPLLIINFMEAIQN